MDRKLLILSASLLAFFLIVVVTKEYVINVITDNVIQKLKRDYVPGPYDPGFDPDKVNPSYFQSEFSSTSED